MEDCSEAVLKKLCCTCLSVNRKLFLLCRVDDGVNNLYLLLSSDTEAYREGFYKDTATLFICWECKAIMRRISQFRRQACVAQKKLTAIAEGRTDVLRTSRALQRHIEFIHENKQLPRDKICHYCGKGFTSSAYLQTHLLSHTGERPHRCACCGASFAHRAALYTHHKRHLTPRA